VKNTVKNGLDQKGTKQKQEEPHPAMQKKPKRSNGIKKDHQKEFCLGREMSAEAPSRHR
jgi:hypothetical protein